MATDARLERADVKSTMTTSFESIKRHLDRLEVHWIDHPPVAVIVAPRALDPIITPTTITVEELSRHVRTLSITIHITIESCHDLFTVK